MSEAQAAFRAVIEAGHYPMNGYAKSYYMCLALDAAAEAGVISKLAAQAGRNAIRRALDGRGNVMAEAMLGRYTEPGEDLQWAIEHGVDLYWNWDERVETLEFPEWTEDYDEHDYYW